VGFQPALIAVYLSQELAYNWPDFSVGGLC
jgi:hypothetical protein